MNKLLKILNEDIDKKIIPNSEKAETQKEPSKPKELVRPKRCQHDGCKVKLMLADFACRCTNFYCSQHRFSTAHQCSFDYKAIGKELLTKQMPTVIGEKFERV
jgi:predicted nucleic acid binding AN1-type Zn finger protein